MLGLLFGEKASKGDNVSIDLLLGYRSHLAIVLRHFWNCVLKMSICILGYGVDMAWKEGGVTYAG